MINTLRGCVFTGIISAPAVCRAGFRHLSWFAFILLFFIAPKFNALHAAVPMPSSLPGEWSAIGRVNIQTTENSAVISGGFAMGNQSLDDAEISFRARTPSGVDQVQIWA